MTRQDFRKLAAIIALSHAHHGWKSTLWHAKDSLCGFLAFAYDNFNVDRWTKDLILFTGVFKRMKESEEELPKALFSDVDLDKLARR